MLIEFPFYKYQTDNKIKVKMNNHSITTARSTHKHPTLPSNTNYAYPFTKTPRFPQPSPPCPQAFYSYSSQLSQRKAGMGFGKKTDFQKLLPNNPPSNRYHIKSLFEPQITKGASFGCSREKSPDKSYLVPQLHRNPGPGNYQNQVHTRMKQEYSLRSKTLDVIEKSKMSNHTPGPGAYESVDFESNGGRTRVSKYSDSKFGTIDPNLERFPQIKQSPGPVQYPNEGGTVAEGRYTLSRHTGGGGRVFSREARFTGEHWHPSKNPGPANYVVPTEFGKGDSNFHQFYH